MVWRPTERGNAYAVYFDHLLVAAYDKHQSAQFFAEVFGLEAPEEAGFFVSVRLHDGVVLSFAEPRVEFPGQHYAFLADDDTFDGILERIRARGITFWADPRMQFPSQINTNHGGAASTGRAIVGRGTVCASTTSAARPN